MNKPQDAAWWESLLEFRWTLDATMERYGWDLPPMLYTVHHVDETGTPVVTVAPVDVWPAVFDRAASFQEALRLARFVHESGQVPLQAPSPVLGVMLVHEGWMLRDPEAIAAGESPSTSPLRVETRFTYLASPDQRYAVLMHERDGIAQDWKNGARGAVPRLLTDLAQAYAS